MGLFGDLMNKIFHHASPETAAHRGPAASSGAEPAPVGAAAPAATATPVDVAAILDNLATKNSENLDWKHSIVDMMKLVGMDSSLSARKTLATELHYSGDMNDSASMNMWLHKEVMKKLSDNGGRVPPELLGH